MELKEVYRLLPSSIASALFGRVKEEEENSEPESRTNDIYVWLW
jgi:hypothetical protein